MRRSSLFLVSLSSVICAFVACQDDSTSSGTTGPSDGGSSSGASGTGTPPPPPPPGSTDAGGGDADGDKPCATTGYYAVTNPSVSPGARLYRVAKTSAEHDVYIGTTKKGDGTAIFGFVAVTATPTGLVGFIGSNALTLTNTLVSIDTTTAVVASIGAPTDTSQTMTALSYGGATGLFLAAYASGELACIDVNGNQFVALLAPTIPPNNEVLKTGALHGQCATDGSYDFRAIHQSGSGPTSYYVHITRTPPAAGMIVEQSPVIAIPGGDGLVDSDSVTLNGTHLIKVGVDGTTTPIRDIDVSQPGDPGPACNQAAAPGGFGAGALLAD